MPGMVPSILTFPFASGRQPGDSASITVYVYDAVAATLLGSWAATSVNNPEDIATDGTDIWILDRSDDKAYRFAGAASRRSGSQSAVSSFDLHSQNGDAYGLATDGTKFWVVDKINGPLIHWD